MTDTEREVLCAPSTGDCVDITAANTTSLDLHVNIVVAELLERELPSVSFLSQFTCSSDAYRALVEGGPGVGGVDLETSSGLWVRHGEFSDYSF